MGQMPDHDSIDERLTDFYHRARVAMSGPVPRWDPSAATAVKHGWGRQLLFAGAAAVFIVAVFAGARYLRLNQSPPAGQNQAGTSPTAEASAKPQPTPPPSPLTGECKPPGSWGDNGMPPNGGGLAFSPGAFFSRSAPPRRPHTPR